ncbi:hypothetical protein [Halorussus caseinilyticus]|uniref:Uncharacterized protein n=1 Tax=Halorussus caseinilyticus TaxID=3034025 RepID=A0ABD5WLE4_9EURY|nr:hypothetical protein [Halorussus sp. DT72]
MEGRPRAASTRATVASTPERPKSLRAEVGTMPRDAFRTAAGTAVPAVTAD